MPHNELVEAILSHRLNNLKDRESCKAKVLQGILDSTSTNKYELMKKLLEKLESDFEKGKYDQDSLSQLGILSFMIEVINDGGMKKWVHKKYKEVERTSRNRKIFQKETK